MTRNARLLAHLAEVDAERRRAAEQNAKDELARAERVRQGRMARMHLPQEEPKEWGRAETDWVI